MRHKRPVIVMTLVLAVAALPIGCASGSPAAPQETASASGGAGVESSVPTESPDREVSPTVCPTEPAGTTFATASEEIAELITTPYAPRSGDGVDVVYFESSNACDCMAAVGDAVDYALLTYFRDELESGELRYYNILSDVPENEALMEEFVSDPTDLFIVEYADGQGVAERVYAIWSLLGEDEAIAECVRQYVQDALDRQDR